jgi:hypothetical protein
MEHNSTPAEAVTTERIGSNKRRRGEEEISEDPEEKRTKKGEETVVMFSVGGTRISTLMSTLSVEPDNIFLKLYREKEEGRNVPLTEGDIIFIDKTPRYLDEMMDWLRNRTCPVGTPSLVEEARYYGFYEMVKAMERGDGQSKFGGYCFSVKATRDILSNLGENEIHVFILRDMFVNNDDYERIVDIASACHVGISVVTSREFKRVTEYTCERAGIIPGADHKIFVYVNDHMIKFKLVKDKLIKGLCPTILAVIASTKRKLSENASYFFKSQINPDAQ